MKLYQKSSRWQNKSIKERFEEKYIPIPESGCWIWLASISNYGYGVLTINGKNKNTHRLSYEIYKGEIPKGMHVCHTCDVPACVNPNHLFLGTAMDNMRDMIKKNRKAIGVNHGYSKLTEEDVKRIRLIGKTKTQSEIAKMFNVTRSLISFVQLNKGWKHINE